MEVADFHRITTAIEEYIKRYGENITEVNAIHAIEEFDEKWGEIIEYRHDERYSDALWIFSSANIELPSISKQHIERLSKLINKYDIHHNVKYKFVVKYALFYNLGSGWHKLGFDNMAIEALKKSIYYALSSASNRRDAPIAYSFKKCTTFLYQSLINEQLNLSSPTTFNDPFDTPIMVLLENSKLQSLVRQAYRDCLKIACFSCNEKLPVRDVSNPINLVVEKKHNEDKAEYLNSLMWAHYADSHKGICIKYRFTESLSRIGCENPNIVSFFKDVIYSSDSMEKYSIGVSKNLVDDTKGIGLSDALFLKGKYWEYENELRFIYYDLNGNGNYATIDIPGCVEAIYFGLNCSSKDVESIQKIMQSKSFITNDTRGNEIFEKIKFYRMEVDFEHFGQLKAKEL